jgi:hypothetical protein
VISVLGLGRRWRIFNREELAMTSNIPTRRGLAKLKLGRVHVRGLVASLVVGALAWPTAASAGTPRYPDLRMFSPTGFGFAPTTVNGEQHYVLRFRTTLWNAGQGPLELDATPRASGLADLTQRIYEDPVGFQDKPIGSLVFSTSSFDVPYIARYELWGRRAFMRAQASGFRRGQPLYVNQDVAYCLADDQHVNVDPTALPDASTVPRYVCSAVREGISVGWATAVDPFNIGQWIDVGTTPVADGDYVVRVIADPENLLYESAGKADPAREGQVANSAVSYVRIVKGQLAGT